MTWQLQGEYPYSLIYPSYSRQLHVPPDGWQLQGEYPYSLIYPSSSRQLHVPPGGWQLQGEYPYSLIYPSSIRQLPTCSSWWMTWQLQGEYPYFLISQLYYRFLLVDDNFKMNILILFQCILQSGIFPKLQSPRYCHLSVKSYWSLLKLFFF